MVSLEGAREEVFDSGFSLADVVYYYNQWVDVPLWVLVSGFNEFTGEYEYGVFRSPKRGDKKYSRKVMFRFFGLLDRLKHDDFFNYRDRRRVSTRLLLVTLTYDRKRKGLEDSWRDVGSDFNRWISNKRRMFGKIDLVRTWESQEAGWCHVHALMLFKDYEFKECWADRKRRWRVRSKDRDRVKSGWGHGWADVQAVSSMRGGFYYVGKYLRKCVDAGRAKSEGLKTLALCWFFRKRAFSVSGGFMGAYHDLIVSLSNSNKEVAFQFLLDADPVECEVVEWRLMGFIKGDFPSWDENWQGLESRDLVELERVIRYVD